MTGNRIQMIQGVYGIKPKDIMHAIKVEGDLGLEDTEETLTKEKEAYQSRNTAPNRSVSPKKSLSPKR